MLLRLLLLGRQQVSPPAIPWLPPLRRLLRLPVGRHGLVERLLLPP